MIEMMLVTPPVNAAVQEDMYGWNLNNICLQDSDSSNLNSKKRLRWPCHDSSSQDSEAAA